MGLGKKTTLFMKHADFEVVAKSRPFMFSLVVAEENDSSVQIPTAVQPLVEEFMDIFPEEIPPRLPFMRDIQHYIDFVSGSSIPSMQLIR